MFESLVGFAALLVLIFLRVPIAFAMIFIGAAGFAWLRGWSATWSVVSSVGFETSLSYTLSVVPLFILMGNLLTISGVSHGLYAAANRLLGARAEALPWHQLWLVAGSLLFADRLWRQRPPCPKWPCRPCASTVMQTAWPLVQLPLAARLASSFRHPW